MSVHGFQPVYYTELSNPEPSTPNSKPITAKPETDIIMLICKNCYTENPDGTHRCRQCNMAGNFVHTGSAEHKQMVWKVEKTIPACKNCGCERPGEGAKCVECNFPNPSYQQKTTQTFESSSHLDFKIG